eukprot:scaffold25626_cov60-Phaeocystis_antarctica.AAC.1
MVVRVRVGVRVGLDLGDGGEAGDDAAIVPAIPRPRERKLQRLEPMLGREAHVLRGGREGDGRGVARLELWLHAHPARLERSSVVRLQRAIEVLPSEHAAAEGAVRQADDAELVRRLGDVALVHAVVEAHVVLHAHGARHAEPIAREAEHRQAVCVLVGEGPVTDQTEVEEPDPDSDPDPDPNPHPSSNLADRSLPPSRRSSVTARTARALPSSPSRRRRSPCATGSGVVRRALGRADAGRVALGGDDDILASEAPRSDAPLEPVAHPPLGRLAVVEGDRVELGRVEEVDAELDQLVQLR